MAVGGQGRRGEGRERSGGAQAASPPRSPSNPPAASGGAPCEGDRQELQACHVECGTGTFRSQDRSQDAGACYPSPNPRACLPPPNCCPRNTARRTGPLVTCMVASAAFCSKRQPWKKPWCQGLCRGPDRGWGPGGILLPHRQPRCHEQAGLGGTGCLRAGFMKLVLLAENVRLERAIRKTQTPEGAQAVSLSSARGPLRHRRCTRDCRAGEGGGWGRRRE